ncbi:MAG: exodeoxyribonuclease VII large subunit [Gemmatimonadota bacterium]|nr:MAG: exodeoxyribonuclease VII large subunit [Gemmatimonadota bacterium]
MNHDLFHHAVNTGALGRDRVAQVWSVSQVNALARELLEGTIPLLWVAGEVSGFKRYPAGHCFFTLKDKRAQLASVMWREAARALPAEPPEGMAVHALGYLTVYERAGRYQFVVRELSAKGEGLWRLAFERLRAKLEAEGLLDPARKRSLPSHPACVGVVTSPEGAAIRDIVSIIRRRAPWTDILIYPTRVQGDEAPDSIVAALGQACRAGRADVLIVGRGGGSLEDLRAFNDERVARAIADSPIPILSAVGHETDVTLADLVADTRAPTPSAAAEIAVPDLSRLRAELRGAGERMAAVLKSSVVRGSQRIERLEERAVEAVRATLARRRLQLEAFRQRLQALGPMEVLERGYALALDVEGKILRGVAGFRPGLEFTVRLKDGRVRARVEAVNEED